MKSVLEEWEILLIVNVALRDGAFNMKKAFKEPGCYIIDLHCIIHGVQLVITVDILDMPSVKALKEEIQKVVKTGLCLDQNQFWKNVMFKDHKFPK